MKITQIIPLLALALLTACDEDQSVKSSSPAAETPIVTEAVEPAPPEHAYPEWEADITGADITIPEDIHTILAVPEGTNPLPEGTLPLKEAVEQALELNREGTDARVLLAPGHYRNNLMLRKGLTAGTSEALLVIEGPEDRSAIVTASSDWSAPSHWQVNPRNPNHLLAKWDKEWGDMDVTHTSPRASETAPWLRVTVTDDVKIHLAWEAAESTNPDSFRLYRQTQRRDQSNRYDGRDDTTESEWEMIYEGAATTFTDSGLVKSKTWDKTYYIYRVSAVMNGFESPFSNSLKAAPGDLSNAARPNQLGRLRELVFVDGTLLQQVLTRDELTPGTYLVDDGFPGRPEDGQLHVMLPEGAKLGESQIDVTTQQEGNWTGSPIWLFEEKKHLAVRNLTVQHHPGHYHSSSAITVRHCANVLIENIDFSWNNGAGFTARNVSDLTIRNIDASDNGGCGLLWSGGGNIVAENLDTHRNNWRGHWGQIYSWAYAGIKCGFGARGMIVRNHRAYDNMAHGLWFDYNVKNLIIDGLDARRNKEYGTFIEALHGPTVFRNSMLIENVQGIHLANSDHVSLHNNLSIGNSHTQVYIIRRKDRKVSDQDLNPDKNAEIPGASGSTIYTPRNVTNGIWTDNIFVATDSEQTILNVAPNDFFFDTLEASGNLYYGPDAERGFMTGMTLHDLTTWQQLSGSDLNAQFADPLFVNAAEDDYTLQANSPLNNRASWPQAQIEDPGYHRLADAIVESAEIRNQIPFENVVDATPEQFVPIDFGPYANHPIDGQQDWAIMKLDTLSAGSHTFHGVPYIIAEDPQFGPSVIALKSTRAKQLPMGDWPTSVRVDMDEQELDTLYILHGGPYSIGHLAIAYYDFYYTDGSKFTAEVYPFGRGSDDGPTMERMQAVATMQDWWPTWNHFEKDDVKPVMLLNEGNPATSARYLYSYEVPNPHPEKPISHMEFRIRYPQGPASPMLVALTGFKE